MVLSYTRIRSHSIDSPYDKLTNMSHEGTLTRKDGRSIMKKSENALFKRVTGRRTFMKTGFRQTYRNSQIRLTGTIFLIFAAVIVLTLGGCDTAEQKRLNAENEARGSENAVRYIEEKYGFTPTVISAAIDRIPGGYGGTATGDVIVKMEYNGTAFAVHINGETTNTDGADSYQTDEIKAATKEFVEEHLPGIVSITYTVDKYYHDFNEKEVIFAKKYDGTNLKDLLSEDVYGMDLCYTYIDLTNKEQFRFLEEIFPSKDHDVRFVSMRSEPIAEEYSEYYSERAIYCYGYYNVTEDRLVTYELRDYNKKFYYCVVPESDGSVVNVTIAASDFGELSDYLHRNSERVTPYTDCYSATADKDCSIEVYFPADDLIGASYDARRNYAQSKRITYSDGRSQADRSFGLGFFTTDENSAYLRELIYIPAGCTVDFGILNITEPDTP